MNLMRRKISAFSRITVTIKAEHYPYPSPNVVLRVLELALAPGKSAPTQQIHTYAQGW